MQYFIQYISKKMKNYKKILATILMVACFIIAGCHYVKRTKTIQSFVVVPSVATLEVGDTRQFHATIIYTDGSRESVTKIVTWTSSDPNIASFAPDYGASAGVINASNTGTTTIYAQYNGLKSRSSQLSVSALNTKKIFLYTATGPDEYGQTFPGGQVSYCAVNSDQKIGDCHVTSWSTFSFAHNVSTGGGVAVDPSGKYAYIGNNTASQGYVAICEINSTNGDFTNCINQSIAPINSGDPGSFYNSIAFDDASNGGLYILEYGQIYNSTYYCSLSEDFSTILTPCTQIMSSRGNNSLDTMTLDPMHTRLYFTGQFSPKKYFFCANTKTQCVLQSAPLAINGLANATPSAIGIRAIDNQTYIADTDNTLHLLNCGIAPNSGPLDTCTQVNTQNTFGQISSVGMVFNSKNSNMYMTTFDQKIWYCTVATEPSNPLCTSKTIPGIAGAYLSGSLAITP